MITHKTVINYFGLKLPSLNPPPSSTIYYCGRPVGAATGSLIGAPGRGANQLLGSQGLDDICYKNPMSDSKPPLPESLVKGALWALEGAPLLLIGVQGWLKDDVLSKLRQPEVFENVLQDIFKDVIKDAAKEAVT
jgi:hypothetical protein